MSKSRIRAISSHIPSGRLTNDELVARFTGWTAAKMEKKLGIVTRPIIEEGRTAVDMAVSAGEALFQSGVCAPEDIDFLVLCTQSPDYFLPSSSCIIQEKLGIPKSCGAFDFNLGCSGYVYGLGIAKGFLEAGLARNFLLITSESYSRYINKDDRVSRPLFGDAATATLVSADAPADRLPIGPFRFGTDGKGADLLIVKAGAQRHPATAETKLPKVDIRGNYHSDEEIQMSGPGIFNFAIDEVPPLIEQIRADCAERNLPIDSYIFHHSNNYMLARLRELCGLENERYYVNMRERGNTVSSSIPIALIDAVGEGFIRRGESAVLVGFGVGLSWGACRIELDDDLVLVG
ncbi:MAG: ketoacyl-ACP synthase III [Thermoguttaceae bacterium]|nr:ketoacyl-ACP synthase III [Thermoguttaceae bacterium]